MVDVMGENTPKAVSTRLGSKLAKIYKDRGLIDGLETPLKQMYTVLKANPVINKINENEYDISVKYSKKFCPIGGNYNPTNAEFFQNIICRPYTIGFLNEISPEFIYELEVKQCILNSNKRTCKYCLRKQLKKD